MHPRRPRWLALLAGTAIALILGTLPAGAEFSPTPVRTSDAFEMLPSAGSDGVNDLLGWSQNSSSRPGHFDTFIKVGANAPMRLTPGDERGFKGSFDGDSFIYQRVLNGNSDLKVYDVGDGTTTNPGGNINNQYWQWSPSHSGEWILYGENRFRHPDSAWKVFLVNTLTDEHRLLDWATYRCLCIAPGQVNGNYATWSECKGITCDVHVHDIALNDSDLLSNPSGRYQYAGVPDTSGTVFLARSGIHCGQSVKLVRYPLGSVTPTLLYSLPDNQDLNSNGSYLYTGVGGEDLLFDQVRCAKNGDSDIYEIEGADGPVPASPVVSRKPGQDRSGNGPKPRFWAVGATP